MAINLTVSTFRGVRKANRWDIYISGLHAPGHRVQARATALTTGMTVFIPSPQKQRCILVRFKYNHPTAAETAERSVWCPVVQYVRIVHKPRVIGRRAVHARKGEREWYRLVHVLEPGAMNAHSRTNPTEIDPMTELCQTYRIALQ